MTVCASCGCTDIKVSERPRPLAFADTMPFADMHEEELDWGADEEPGYELNCERARGRVVDLHRGWEWPLQAHEPPACGQEALTFAIFSAHLSSQNRCRRGMREPPQSTRRVAAGRSRQACPQGCGMPLRSGTGRQCIFNSGRRVHCVERGDWQCVLPHQSRHTPACGGGGIYLASACVHG